MKILEHIAQEIAEKTAEILGYPISITDKDGYIIGSTDRSRLGSFHKPSLDVIQKNSMVHCELGVEKKLKNVLPGVSVPIMFNHKAIGVLGIVGDPAEVEKYVQLVKNHVEMMCQEAFRREMLNLEARMVEVFVQQLVHFENDEKADYLLQYASTLNYDLEVSRACILIDIDMSSRDLPAPKARSGGRERFSFPHIQRDVLDFLTLIFKESKDDIISCLNVERFIVIKPVKAKEQFSTLVGSLEQKLDKLNRFLASKYRLSAAISVGDLKNGIRGVTESYRNAAKAMAVGRQTDQAPKIYLYNDLDITLKLLPRELSTDFQKKLAELIQPLLEHDNYDILASTFLTYCKHNLNLSETARNMYIHRNTIIYRLEKISELTSLDTSSFEHCMLLYTAIRHYEQTKG